MFACYCTSSWEEQIRNTSKHCDEAKLGHRCKSRLRPPLNPRHFDRATGTFSGMPQATDTGPSCSAHRKLGIGSGTLRDDLRGRFEGSKQRVLVWSVWVFSWMFPLVLKYFFIEEFAVFCYCMVHLAQKKTETGKLDVMLQAFAQTHMSIELFAYTYIHVVNPLLLHLFIYIASPFRPTILTQLSQTLPRPPTTWTWPFEKSPWPKGVAKEEARKDLPSYTSPSDGCCLSSFPTLPLR